MKRPSTSPSAYIASVHGEQKEILTAIRNLIFEVDPQADEYIEYGMLAYSELANLAAQKHYVSLYVAPTALAEHKKTHPRANCGKSCLRFTSLKSLDPPAIKTLLHQIQTTQSQAPSQNPSD